VPDELVRIVHRSADYEVNADGTGTLEVNYALSPMKRIAIDAVGQQTLGYQEGMSDIEILEAYTLKQDGRRVDVPADRIITQSPPGFANAAIFTDMKMKRMVFSDLDVGDQVVFRYKRRWITPLFPGQFFDSELFPQSSRYDDVRVTLKHPANYLLQVQTRGLIEQPAEEKDGIVSRAWRYQNSTAIPEEPGAVSSFDRDPVFEVTSFKSWGDIAAAYNSRAKDKSAVSPEIRKLADEITKNIKDKRQQAVAIYAWVVKNIRYVAVYLGAGGYVPHTADSILTNRYGDCKDYTTLFSALLDAKGIANEPVMIDATNRFQLPDVPTPAAFNHAISYLPDFKLYLDTTARQLPFGMLAALEANKFALHTRKFSGLVRTPNLSQSERRLTSRSNFTVADDGSIKGVSTISATGTLGLELGVLLDRLDNPQVSKQLATTLLSLEGLAGTADFSRLPRPSPEVMAAYKSDFTVGNWINTPGPGAVRLSTGLLSINSLRLNATQMLNSPPAKLDRLCYPGVIEEFGTIELPASIKPSNIPKDVEASNALVSYSAKYSREGNTIKVFRKLDMRFPTTVCKAEELNAYREILEQVRRDTSAQMTYE
jgi:transglutaminase-like putative cysteine protease